MAVMGLDTYSSKGHLDTPNAQFSKFISENKVPRDMKIIASLFNYFTCGIATYGLPSGACMQPQYLNTADSLLTFDCIAHSNLFDSGIS